MARWVMSAKPDAVLDPAAGLGNLLRVCSEIDGKAVLVGVEQDGDTFRLAKGTAPRGTKLILADYLFSESGRFQGIIANPPYVKSQRLKYSEDEWRYFDERFGVRLDRLTNLYAIFLLKIWDDLAPGGRAAVLLPAEFLNANFGEEIKARLLDEMEPAGMIVFSPELNLFEDALTTSAILFLERHGGGKPRCVAAKAASVEEAARFVGLLLGETLDDGGLRLHDLRKFLPKQKWLNTLLEESPSDDALLLNRRIGDYFQCRRGIATGANDYFCLSGEMLAANGLDASHVEPCVTKATDADGLVFTAARFGALAKDGRRCFLLNPKADSTSLGGYLRVGELLGIPERHLPSHRPVWYLPENRAVAEIWVAVFSREVVKFILNESGAKNLTCFHGLYSRKAEANLAPLLVLFLNSSWGRIAFSQVNRFYGDGLNKLEPKDVEAMPCPEFPPQSSEQAKRLAATLLELESVPEPERKSRMDQMISELVGLPIPRTGGTIPAETEPPALRLHPTKKPRRAAPRKHRADQVR